MLGKQRKQEQFMPARTSFRLFFSRASKNEEGHSSHAGPAAHQKASL